MAACVTTAIVSIIPLGCFVPLSSATTLDRLGAIVVVTTLVVLAKVEAMPWRPTLT